MKSLDRITEKIEVLRAQLTDLILIKEVLTDQEIVRVSKLLDKALNEYNSIVFKGFSSELNTCSRKIG